MTHPYQIEIRTDNTSDPAIIFHLYLDSEGTPNLFLPMSGWIGALEARENSECRPFVLHDNGTLDFGSYVPDAVRHGAIHWSRLSRYHVGAEMGVTLADDETTYRVFRISRL